ncbi:hypothetical protein KUCAC02_033934 [Chaenocephalus aceratus]|nr:hypothetical protein KUCAC02_033934 [Chaenocephalus aceratus]
MFLPVIFGVVMAMTVTPGSAARVVSGLKFWSPSGQTVCLRGPDGPCYKIAFFHDVTSRVSFREAGQACKTDGGD